MFDQIGLQVALCGAGQCRAVFGEPSEERDGGHDGGSTVLHAARCQHTALGFRAQLAQDLPVGKATDDLRVLGGQCREGVGEPRCDRLEPAVMGREDLERTEQVS